MYEHIKQILDDEIFPLSEHNAKDVEYDVTDEAVAVIGSGKSVGETEKYIWVVVNDIGVFRKDSFRTVWISKEKGINSIEGKAPDDETASMVQTLLFLKTKWSRQGALMWTRAHGWKPKGVIKEYTAKSGLIKIEDGKLVNSLPPDLVMEKMVNARFEIKHIDKAKKTIKGWASTRDVDSDGEVVLPIAFRDTLDSFMRNPMMFYMHSWRNAFPIGQVTKAEIVEDVGLWIEAEITTLTDAGKTVWALIQARLLRAFSIGFSNAVRDKRDDGLTYIIKLKLWEISVVSLPANENALISMAKAQGIEMDNLSVPASPLAFELAESMECKSKQINKEKEVSEMKIEDIQKQVTDVEVKTKKNEGLILQVQEAAKNATTKAELQEVIDKCKADLIETFDKQYKTLSERKLRFEAESLGYDGLFLKKPYLKHDLAFLNCHTPVEKFAKLFEIPSIKMPDLQVLQSAADDMLLVHWILRSFSGDYAGLKSLKLYDRYSQIAQDFAKALDTATSGEGLDWIPTLFSADLITKYRLQLKVAALFPWFTIPAGTGSYKWPTLSGAWIAYKIPENVGDIGVKIPASTGTTGAVTFTPAKLACRAVFSEDINEDSIISILPILKAEIALAMAEGLENAVINGDTTATHFDTGYTVATNDQRRIFKGLRKLANSSGKVDIGTSFPTGSTIRGVRKAMGKYGVDPSQLAWITGISAYIKLLSMTQIATAEKFMASATWLKGYLTALDGSPIVVSEKVAEDLNASGIYDGVTETKTIMALVNKLQWIIGEKRSLTVKGKEDVETDQKVAVITQRLDMQKMRPAADNPVGIGYNITSA